MPNPSTDALEAQVTAIAEGVVAEHGASVYDVEVHLGGGTGTVRLTVDRADGSGITIGEVTAIAKQVGYLLDADDVIPTKYDFEVTSPGIERPLRRDRHYAGTVGEEVRLVLRNALADGRKVVEGKLEAFADGIAVVIGASGERTEVDVTNVRRGRTVFDFGAPRGEES
jgi:ribosome maturation factor RimP